MSQSQSFIKEYNVAPSPMAGVAGRMKSMGQMAAQAGGGDAAYGAMDAGMASLKSQEALSQMQREMTSLRGLQQSDALAHQETMAQVQLDADKATDIFEDINYYGTAAIAVHKLADKAVSASEGKGTATVNEEGEVEYTPGESSGIAKGLLKPLRDILNVIPANRRASEARRDATAVETKSVAKIEYADAQEKLRTEEFLEVSQRLESLEVQNEALSKQVLDMNYDEAVAGRMEVQRTLIKGLKDFNFVDRTMGGFRNKPSAVGEDAADDALRVEIDDHKANNPQFDEAQVKDIAKKSAAAHGVPEDLFMAVVSAESGFKQYASNPSGARGAGQLMPDTAKDMGVKDRYDPNDNLAGSAKYLGVELPRLIGTNDVDSLLIAYNWGPGKFNKWKAAGSDMSKLPKETQDYLKKIKRIRNRYKTSGG